MMFRRRNPYTGDAGTIPSFVSNRRRSKYGNEKICSPLNMMLTIVALCLACYYHLAMSALSSQPEVNNAVVKNLRQDNGKATVPAIGSRQTSSRGTVESLSSMAGTIRTYAELTTVNRLTKGKHNVALGKKTSQSSVDWEGDSDRAVDGKPNQDWDSKSLTATKKECNPWWQVDLGGSYRIEDVVVLNRGDCCKERLRSLHVQVLDRNGNGPGWKVVADLFLRGFANTVVHGNFSPIVKGQMVRLQLEVCEVLSIAEVEVYGNRV